MMRAIESGRSASGRPRLRSSRPGGGERRQRLPPPPLQQAEGEGRVHLAHAELQPAARGVEVEAAAAAHLDAVGRARCSEAARRRWTLSEVALPDHRVELADDLVALALLDQLEVEVPAARSAAPAAPRPPPRRRRRPRRGSRAPPRRAGRRCRWARGAAETVRLGSRQLDQ